MRRDKIRTVAVVSPTTSAVLESIKIIFGLRSKWDAIEILIRYARGDLSRRERRVLKEILNHSNR